MPPKTALARSTKREANLAGVAFFCAVTVVSAALSPWARASCDGVADQVDVAARDVGRWDKAVSILNATGVLPAGIAQSLKRLKTGAKTVRGYCQCVAGTADALACAAELIRSEAFCVASGIIGSGFSPLTPFTVIALAVPSAGNAQAGLAQKIVESGIECNSEGSALGSLKCCKYLGQTGCHSAFNTPMPVNCEGNPGFGATASSYGQCMVPPTGIGCLCTHIPDCQIASDGAAPQSPYADQVRRIRWFQELAAAFENTVAKRAVGATTSCGADFGMFVGCKCWLDVIRHAEPFHGFDNLAPDDAEAAARLRGALSGQAALRVMYAVPNGLARFDHVARLQWSQTQVDEYLGGVDPIVALSKWLSPCGIELLAASLPIRWQLLAVPAPDEPPITIDLSHQWRDGCPLGVPPGEPKLAATANGALVNLLVDVDDHEKPCKDIEGAVLRIDWGDDTTDHAVYSFDQENIFEHKYRGPGEYQVRVIYMSTAGHFSESSITVQVQGAAVTKRLRTYSSVTIPVSIRSNRDVELGMVGLDAAGEAHELGSNWISSTGGAVVHVGALRFLVPGSMDLKQVELTVAKPNSGFADIWVSKIEVEPFASGLPASKFKAKVNVSHFQVISGGVVGTAAPITGPALFNAGSLARYRLSIPCAVAQCGTDPAYGIGCGQCPTPLVCLPTRQCAAWSDVTGDGQYTVVDVQCTLVAVLWQLNGGEAAGPAPACLALGGDPRVADLNCDGAVTVADSVVAVQLALSGVLSLELDADGNTIVDACEASPPPEPDEF